jgi:predicted ArsR family transcriptional regulator
MRTTRQTVLEALQVLERATVNELADRVGIKAITMRHHLNTLQAEGLVTAEEKRQPIGRPIYVYSLTDQGRQAIPRTNSLLVERLLDQIKEALPPAAVEGLIGALALTIAEDVRHEFDDLPPGQRMHHLIELLTREGFAAEWRQTDQGLRLVEHQCPYVRFGQRHPELCQIDETLIRTALGADVEKLSCLLAGDTACTYALLAERNAV